MRDRGVGIPPGQLAKMFEMFHQEERAQGQSQGGLGIGLWLTRRLVDMHGGTVQARSDGADRGAEFVISLPGSVCQAPEVPDPAGAAPAPRRSRILVVDDNVDAAETTSILLGSLGYVVEEAHDGEEALQTAGRFRPDVVLLDLAMPKLDGYEVCARLRKGDSRLPRVIALSGWGAAADKALTAAAGFDAHLVKPVDRDELLATIDRLLALPAA